MMERRGFVARMLGLPLAMKAAAMGEFPYDGGIAAVVPDEVEVQTEADWVKDFYTIQIRKEGDSEWTVLWRGSAQEFDALGGSFSIPASEMAGQSYSFKVSAFSYPEWEACP